MPVRGSAVNDGSQVRGMPTGPPHAAVKRTPRSAGNQSVNWARRVAWVASWRS